MASTCCGLMALCNRGARYRLQSANPCEQEAVKVMIRLCEKQKARLDRSSGLFSESAKPPTGDITNEIDSYVAHDTPIVSACQTFVFAFSWLFTMSRESLINPASASSVTPSSRRTLPTGTNGQT